MTAAKSPEKIVRTWIDAVNAYDVRRASRMAAETVVTYTPEGELPGRDFVREWIRLTRIQFTPIDIRAEGNTVFVLASAT